MIYREFWDGHPRTSLELSFDDGAEDVEFIIDTGFEGDLSLPGRLARCLRQPSGFRSRALADGRLIKCPYFRMFLPWLDGRNRITEVLVLEGSPLMGTTYLHDALLQIELSDGGEVTAELI